VQNIHQKTTNSEKVVMVQNPNFETTVHTLPKSINQIEIQLPYSSSVSNTQKLQLEECERRIKSLEAITL